MAKFDGTPTGLTDFGIELRKLRLDLRMSGAEMEREIGLEHHWRIETGGMVIPDWLIPKLVHYYKLDPAREDALRRAEARTRPKLDMRPLPGPCRELLVMLHDRVEKLNPHQRKLIEATMLGSSK